MNHERVGEGGGAYNDGADSLVSNALNFGNKYLSEKLLRYIAADGIVLRRLQATRLQEAPEYIVYFTTNARSA